MAMSSVRSRGVERVATLPYHVAVERIALPTVVATARTVGALACVALVLAGCILPARVDEEPRAVPVPQQPATPTAVPDTGPAPTDPAAAAPARTAAVDPAVTTSSISVAEGDWDEARTVDIAAVLRSAAACFQGAVEERTVDTVLVEPSAADDTVPRSLFARAAGGETRVHLHVRGRHWAQFAFQFGHEFCHVLSNHRVMADRPFGWINECLCETASLYALRSMARTWETSPPYPNWRDYARSLGEYAEQRCAEPEHTLPDGAVFSTWLAARLPALAADPGKRADNVVIAKRMLPVFEQNPDAWRAVRYLNLWDTTTDASIQQYFAHWRDAAPSRLRSDIDRIERALTVD